MPNIRPSSDLRNKYNEISEFCHKYSEPVYITKNGQGDLVVMSIEVYEKLVGKIKDAVISLANMPARHAPVADERLAAQGIRKLSVKES